MLLWGVFVEKLSWLEILKNVNKDKRNLRKPLISSLFRDLDIEGASKYSFRDIEDAINARLKLYAVFDVGAYAYPSYLAAMYFDDELAGEVECRGRDTCAVVFRFIDKEIAFKIRDFIKSLPHRINIRLIGNGVPDKKNGVLDKKREPLFHASKFFNLHAALNNGIEFVVYEGQSYSWKMTDGKPGYITLTDSKREFDVSMDVVDFTYNIHKELLKFTVQENFTKEDGESV